VPVLSLVLLVLFIACIVLQCFYASYFFVRIFHFPTPAVKNKTAETPVSIIICAKNEARNLEKNLPAILSQIYANAAGKTMYEVIVVNDASTDDTATVLQQLEQRYNNLWSVHITAETPRDLKGKKFALSKGVQHATHDWLVFTDADCTPSSHYWLQNIVAPIAGGKQIVAGYGGYHKTAGLLNAWIRWETLHTFLQYSTYALAGKPYMAVGRNMACTKAIFNKAQSSAVWNAVPSGDDDLLMSIVATAENTAVVYNKDCFTISTAKTTWRGWLLQKQRHMSTGKYYKSDIKNLLGLYGAAHALLWLSFFALLATAYWQIALMAMLCRSLICWGIMAATSLKLKAGLLFSLPFFDLGWLLYNFALSPYIFFKNKTRWT